MKLTEIQLPSQVYTHVFIDKNGIDYEVLTTKEDYEQLGTANPINPIDSNGTWKYSHSSYKLPLGTFARQNTDLHLVNLDGLTFSISKDLMIRDTITQAGINRITELKHGISI